MDIIRKQKNIPSYETTSYSENLKVPMTPV